MLWLDPPCAGQLTHIQHQQQCWQTLMEEVSSQAVSDLERQAARTSPALRAESLPQELVETWQPVAIASGEELNRQMAPLWVRRRCLGAQPKLTTALRNYLAVSNKPCIKHTYTVCVFSQGELLFFAIRMFRKRPQQTCPPTITT